MPLEPVIVFSVSIDSILMCLFQCIVDKTQTEPVCLASWPDLLGAENSFPSQ